MDCSLSYTCSAMDIQTTTTPARDLPRRLGLLDSTSIVVGTMIGSAIFLVPSTIAQNIHSVPITLAMWLIAGVVSMFGALAYAELGAMMPVSGGQYVYLTEALGPLWGFLCGWAFFLWHDLAPRRLLLQDLLPIFRSSCRCLPQRPEAWRQP